MRTKRERAKKIKEILDEYFPSPKIPLFHKDPFTLLVAVLLSAQCTDERVNKVTPTLFQLADTPKKIAECKEEEIERIIRPLGLSKRKASAIKRLSALLVENYDGAVPPSIEELEQLPGVGHKTASVVAAQGFKIPSFPVDTHIHRCAYRWGLSSGKNVETTERDLKLLFHKKDWNRVHLQIIYFARSFCPARGHSIERCPICSQYGVVEKV